MMKKYSVVICAFLVIGVIVLLLVPTTEQIKLTTTVSTLDGETAEVDVDILCYSSLVLPSYIKGTLYVDDIKYIDQYTKLKEFPAVSDNRLFPIAWWSSTDSVPYNMTFIRADCSDVTSALLNRIDVMDVRLNKGACEIHYMYADDSNMVGAEIEGISFWGPAQNAEEAKQIAESFGYKIS
jgi:hypothetical protein